MRTTIEHITPFTASLMLKSNTSNRKIRSAAVEMYARDMAHGKWKLTHQGILLGKNGTVIDGQHRLHAIIKSNTSHDIMVTRDDFLESAIELPVDTGNKRNLSFVLGVDKNLSAVASFAMSIISNIRSFSPSDIKPLCDLYAAPMEVLLQCKSTKRGVSIAPVQLAGITRIILGDDKDYICKSYSAMLNNKFLEMSPMVASFYKQVVVDRTRFDHRQMLSRAIRVFDYRKSNLSKLLINNEELALREARDLVIAGIETSKKVAA